MTRSFQQNLLQVISMTAHFPPFEISSKDTIILEQQPNIVIHYNFIS